MNSTFVCDWTNIWKYVSTHGMGWEAGAGVSHSPFYILLRYVALSLNDYI